MFPSACADLYKTTALLVVVSECSCGDAVSHMTYSGKLHKSAACGTASKTLSKVCMASVVADVGGVSGRMTLGSSSSRPAEWSC